MADRSVCNDAISRERLKRVRTIEYSDESSYSLSPKCRSSQAPANREPTISRSRFILTPDPPSRIREESATGRPPSDEIQHSEQSSSPNYWFGKKEAVIGTISSRQAPTAPKNDPFSLFSLSTRAFLGDRDSTRMSSMLQKLKSSHVPGLRVAEATRAPSFALYKEYARCFQFDESRLRFCDLPQGSRLAAWLDGLPDSSSEYLSEGDRFIKSGPGPWAFRLSRSGKLDEHGVVAQKSDFPLIRRGKTRQSGRNHIQVGIRRIDSSSSDIRREAVPRMLSSSTIGRSLPNADISRTIGEADRRSPLRNESERKEHDIFGPLMSDFTTADPQSLKHRSMHAPGSRVPRHLDPTALAENVSGNLEANAAQPISCFDYPFRSGRSQSRSFWRPFRDLQNHLDENLQHLEPTPTLQSECSSARSEGSSAEQILDSTTGEKTISHSMSGSLGPPREFSQFFNQPEQSSRSSFSFYSFYTAPLRQEVEAPPQNMRGAVVGGTASSGEVLQWPNSQCCSLT